VGAPAVSPPEVAPLLSASPRSDSYLRTSRINIFKDPQAPSPAPARSPPNQPLAAAMPPASGSVAAAAATPPTPIPAPPGTLARGTGADGSAASLRARSLERDAAAVGSPGGSAVPAAASGSRSRAASVNQSPPSARFQPTPRPDILGSLATINAMPDLVRNGRWRARGQRASPPCAHRCGGPPVMCRMCSRQPPDLQEFVDLNLNATVATDVAAPDPTASVSSGSGSGLDLASTRDKVGSFVDRLQRDAVTRSAMLAAGGGVLASTASGSAPAATATAAPASAPTAPAALPAASSNAAGATAPPPSSAPPATPPGTVAAIAAALTERGSDAAAPAGLLDVARVAVPPVAAVPPVSQLSAGIGSGGALWRPLPAAAVPVPVVPEPLPRLSTSSPGRGAMALAPFPLATVRSSAVGDGGAP